MAEMVPIEPVQRLLVRWVEEGLIAEPPPGDSAKAGTVSSAARRVLGAQPPSGPTATEILLQMREDERT